MMISFSNKKPTRPGYYYARNGNFTTIIKIIKQPHKKGIELLLFGTEHKFPLSAINNSIQYSGPIDIPEGD